MNLNLYLYIIPFLFTIISCNCKLINNHQKENSIFFKTYFRNLEKKNLQTDFKGYSYIKLRDDNYRLEFPSGTKVFFRIINNCNIKIKNIQQNQNKKFTKEQIEEKTIEVLNKFRKYNIIHLESTNVKFKIHINKNIFNPNSLPSYKEERNKKSENIVLLHLYSNKQNKITKKIIEYYKPIKLGDKWYFYEE